MNELAYLFFKSIPDKVDHLDNLQQFFSYINKIIALTFVKWTEKERRSDLPPGCQWELQRMRVSSSRADCKLKTAHFNHVGFIQYCLYLELFKMNS